ERCVFVDRAVAAVVLTIAALRPSGEGRVALEPATYAGLSADGALSLRAAHRTSGAHARQRLPARGVVEHSVTVVVDAVAELRTRENLLLAIELACHAV